MSRSKLGRCMGAVGLVAAFALGFATRSVATVTTTVTLDGVWWKALTYDGKLIAVQGMLVGFNAGYTQAMAMADFHVGGDEGRRLGIYLNKAQPTFAYRSFATTANNIDSVFDSYPKLLTQSVSVFVVCSAATNFGNCTKLAEMLSDQSHK